jgi:GntR family transcriptional regulator/MocR family aminotransferase
VEVYGQLVAEGWLRARTGVGTVVSERVESAAVATPEIVHTYPVLGAFDMRPGWPDLSAFPRREWLSAARRALTAASPEALNYNEPRGRPELRHALADYLSRARGVRADPNQIVVCLGTMHGLQIIGKALRARGATTWATESHGLHVHRDAATALGYTVRVLPVDADVTQLTDDDAVLLSPAHQFPLGVALSPRGRSLERLDRWPDHRRRLGRRIS